MDDHELRAALAEVLARRGISAEETVVGSSTILRPHKRETTDPETTGRTRARETPHEIRALLDRLGIDYRDPWVWLATDGPISPDNARLLVDDGGPGWLIELEPTALPAWDGYQFNLIGIRWQHPPMILGRIQDWGSSLGLLDVRYMHIRWRQSPLYNEYLVSECDEEDLTTRGRLSPHTGEDWKKAQAGRDLILDALPMSLGGRPKIGDDPADGELVLAREARKLEREHPTWSRLRIAHHIGLVEAVEDEGRSRCPERAAVARLGRYIKRLEELGG